MPKLVVLVDKDDTGKLWNYILTEEAVRNQNLFETAALWVHKSDSSENGLQSIRPTEHAEEDHVTLRLLLPREEVHTHIRIKKK